MQAQPGEGAAVSASRRSTGRWRASTGTTAVHICFGYAARVVEQAVGLFVLCRSSSSRRVDQVSIETAQSKLDCSVLAKLPSKTIMLGVLDLST